MKFQKKVEEGTSLSDLINKLNNELIDWHVINIFSIGDNMNPTFIAVLEKPLDEYEPPTIQQ